MRLITVVMIEESVFTPVICIFFLFVLIWSLAADLWGAGLHMNTHIITSNITSLRGAKAYILYHYYCCCCCCSLSSLWCFTNLPAVGAVELQYAASYVMFILLLILQQSTEAKFTSCCWFISNISGIWQHLVLPSWLIFHTLFHTKQQSPSLIPMPWKADACPWFFNLSMLLLLFFPTTVTAIIMSRGYVAALSARSNVSQNGPLTPSPLINDCYLSGIASRSVQLPESAERMRSRCY